MMGTDEILDQNLLIIRMHSWPRAAGGGRGLGFEVIFFPGTRVLPDCCTVLINLLLILKYSELRMNCVNYYAFVSIVIYSRK